MDNITANPAVGINTPESRKVETNWKDGRFYRHDLAAGSYEFPLDPTTKRPLRMDFVCPCGCGSVCALGINEIHYGKNPTSPTSPTFSRPFARVDANCKFTKGWLIRGVWTSDPKTVK